MSRLISFLFLVLLTACTGKSLGGDGVPVTGVKSEKRYQVRLLTGDYILGVGFADSSRRLVQIYNRSTGVLLSEVTTEESAEASRLVLTASNFSLAFEDYTVLTTVDTTAVKYLADISLGGVVIQDDYFSNTLPSGLGGRVLDCTASASVCSVALDLDSSWFDLTNLSFYLPANGMGAVSTILNGIVESSLNLFAGTASDGADGSFVYNAGAVNTAIEFDGVNDSINFPVSATDMGIEGANPKSFVAWVNPSQLDNTVYQMGSSVTCGSQVALKTRGVEGQWELDMKCASRRVMFDCGNLNTWSHVAVVIVADIAKVYCNGLLAEENTIATRSLVADELSIGEVDGEFFQGKLDDFSIWSQVLSAEDIFIIYTQQNPSFD